MSQPIPQGWVPLFPIRERLGLNRKMAEYILAKFKVETITGPKRHLWVNPQAFMDAYDASRKPDARVAGMVKVRDAADDLGIDYRALHELCLKHDIPRVFSDNKGMAAYISPEDVQKVCSLIEAAKQSQTKQPERLVASQRGDFDPITEKQKDEISKSIKAHYAELERSRAEHNERVAKRLRLESQPLTPAQEIARWRAEHKAAMKRRHDPIVLRVVEAAKEAKPPRKPFHQRPQAGWLNQSV